MERTSEYISRWREWVGTHPGAIVLDGGLGHTLVERGNDLNVGKLWSGRLVVVDHDELRLVADDWLKAGADIISTATYQVTLDGLQLEFEIGEKEAEKYLHESCNVLDKARQLHWESLSNVRKMTRRYPKIALSMGPLNAILEDGNEYVGAYSDGISHHNLFSFHLHRAQKFSSICKADVLCFETIGNVEEAVAIVNAMSQPPLQHLPYWISFQCCNNHQIASRQQLSTAVTAVLQECQSRNIIAIGINCYQASWTLQLVGIVSKAIQAFMHEGSNETLFSNWRVKVVAYPNNGEVYNNGAWTWPSAEPIPATCWASSVLKSGAHIIGGCCRIGPSHIRVLREEVNQELDKCT